MARTRRPGLPIEKGRAIASIRQDSSQLQNYLQYRDDVEFVLALISAAWMPCPHPATTTEQQREWRHFHELPQHALAWATDRFCQDEFVARQVVQENWRALAYVTHSVRADRDVVLTAVRNSRGDALEYAADELKADRSLILNAVRTVPSVWRFATDELQADRDFAMAVLEATRYYSLEFMSEEYKTDRNLIRMAVQNINRGSGLILKFASDQLRNDFEIVQLAVQNHGSALEFASDELRSNREIVLAAVQHCGHALLFCSNSNLLADRAIVLEAVSNWGDALQVASEDLKNDREIVQQAVQHSLSALQYASTELKADVEIGRMAIEVWPLNFEFVASKSLKSDKDVALMALQREVNVFRYLSENLQNDLDVVYKALWKDSDIFLSSYWDGNDDENANKVYCQNIKARFGSLARAVLSMRNTDIDRTSPGTFATGWQVAVDERHAALFHLSLPTLDDSGTLPREVQSLICDFSSEAHYASELLLCGPLIELFLENSYCPHDDWLQFLNEYEHV